MDVELGAYATVLQYLIVYTVYILTNLLEGYSVFLADGPVLMVRGLAVEESRSPRTFSN